MPRILWGWLMSCMIGWTTSDQPPVTPQVELQLHHGVYFQPLGEVIVTGSDWTVCTTISLSTYEEAHASLLGQIEQVDWRLDEAKRKTAASVAKTGLLESFRAMWDTLSEAFKQDLANYQNDIQIVKRTAMQTDKRNSRGLINVVSNVGKYLFGFSTEKDVSALATKINQLASRESNLSHLADQQFSYIKSVASQTLHNGEQVLKLQASFAGMVKALEALQNVTSVLNVGVQFTGVGLEMLTAIELIREGLSQSRAGLYTIQQIMAKAGEGMLAWELFEEPVFRRLLLDLGNQLPTGWTLLYDADDHYSYLHYIATEAHRSPEGLNLCMAIPIIKKSGRYQLYKAISMPVVHPKFPAKLFFSYNFGTSYLAIQKDGSDYFTSLSGGEGNYFIMDNQREAKCVGENPRVCSLYGAVTAPSPDQDSCLYDLFTDNPSSTACPVQIQYHDGPMFRHVGLGVWLYGAAKGHLQVRCLEQASQPDQTTGHYELTGTGAFRLQPGCEALLGHIKIPSYVNGKGQFKVDLPDAPIVNLFSMNFTRSLWQNITSQLSVPDNFTSFLRHLNTNSDIHKTALNLKEFNNTIKSYLDLQNQLPSYHPYVWASNPKGEVTGFTFVLLLNLTSTAVLAIGLWKLRGRLNTMTENPTAATAATENLQLIRVRRRRRQTSDQVA